MCKKDSFDRITEELRQAAFELGRVGAVLLWEKHKRLWGQMDKGVPYHQGSGGRVEKSGFALSCSQERDGRELSGLGGDFSLSF